MKEISKTTTSEASAGATAPPKRPRGRPRKTAATESVETVRTRKAPVRRTKKVEAVSPAAIEKPASRLTYIFSTGRRKRAVARAYLYQEGNGEIEVNGKPMEHFFGTNILQDIVRAPLAQSSFEKSLRIVVKVRGGGVMGQAEATRLAITHGLLKLDDSLRPVFRARGYLTRDSREKERKKPGLKRARRAPQWQKR